MHILCWFFKVVQRAYWTAIFLPVKNILRVPFLPRAPPFYTAHARLSEIFSYSENNTVFPRSNAAATNCFLLLKLAAIIRGRRLLEGGDNNYYCIIIYFMI